MKPVVLITGASSGIGAALARVFADNGHELALVARRQDRLDALADSMAVTGRARPAVLALDLERRDGASAIAAELSARGLEPAIVVNNAGFGLTGAAAALSRELAGQGIRVTALCPGPVLTEFQARSGMALDPAARVLELSAERVAQIGYDALMRGERVAVAGIGNRIAVSLMHLVPNALLLRLVDQRPRALRNKH